jgi:hypothetical protein
MSTPRPYPWTSLIEALGAQRFEDLRAALATAGTDALDRDAFLLNAAAGRLLRDLVPDDAPAEAVTGYGALLHALYVHWDRGSPVRSLDQPTMRRMLSEPPGRLPVAPLQDVCYVQLPERVVWAAPAPDAAHEPMDGVFVLPAPRRLRVVAVLGFRPERHGFTTLEADAFLPAAAPASRPDGSAPFATVLPAGERMGFFSVTSDSELAALALLALAAARG